MVRKLYYNAKFLIRDIENLGYDISDLVIEELKETATHFKELKGLLMGDFPRHIKKGVAVMIRYDALRTMDRIGLNVHYGSIYEKQ